METIAVTTTKRNELCDITASLQQLVKHKNWRSGIVHLHVPHTTAGIVINENCDPDVSRDIAETLAKLIPAKGGYAHQEGNADSHIKSAVVGISAQVLVQDGALALGRWQGIFFAEFDGPRSREVWVAFAAA
jgi:secondary thiamine-phosphate synthase enzyme